MKNNPKISVTAALLKKQWIEKTYPYKRKNFDIAGFFLKLAVAAVLVAAFVVFFGRFTDVYKVIMTDYRPDPVSRVRELLTAVYTVIIVFMTAGAVSLVNRELFAADDIKIFSAMPVSARSVFAAKLVHIYFSQLAVSAVMVITVNVTIAWHVPQTGAFYAVTALTCFIMPLISIALGCILALPFRFLKKFVDGKYILIFIIVTAVAAALLYLYSIVLGAVKGLLVNGGEIKRFFSEARMNSISAAVSFMYPANWIADLAVGKNVAAASLWIILVIAACVTLSMLIIGNILRTALQSRFTGRARKSSRGRKFPAQRNAFFALVKKEFLVIFRTPSYMFSYLSMAIVLPLMVYFCMSVGSSMVQGLVGLDVNLELALFLTLLFGALTNVFCATNVSRDGEMFYAVKALPLGCRTVMFSKVFLCMAVAAFSQLISAALLAFTGFISWPVAVFLFFTGSLFGFVHICVATRYDLNHARFSTEEDGEINQSSAVSAIVLIGLFVSAFVGCAVFVLRIVMLLRNRDLVWLTYLFAGGVAAVAAVLAYLYFIIRLEKRFNSLEGGNFR